MTASWTDPGFATDWAQHDAQRDLLDLPRRLAVQILAEDRPDAAVVVDIGSGPGDFLAVVLDRLPAAHGIWTDISPEMAEIARRRLAPYGDRVDYHLTGMEDIAAHLPERIDAVVTSRVVHHLDAAGVRELYRTLAEHLAPGGWLINLDHTTLAPDWERRTRQARKELIPRSREQRAHHHVHPTLPTIDDHLDALRSAGFTDVDVPWRAFVTCLFMARKDGA